MYRILSVVLWEFSLNVPNQFKSQGEKKRWGSLLRMSFVAVDKSLGASHQMKLTISSQ